MAESKVMRLGDQEVELIQFLRNTNKSSVLNELNSAYEKVPNIILEQIINILGNQKSSSLTMDVLVNTDLLTSQDASFLLNCINDNKSIIITGSTASGKTTLARALFQHIDAKETSVLTFEYDHEFTMDANAPKLTLTDIVLSKKFGVNSSGNIPTRVVVGDISTIDDAMVLLTALDNGMSILTTTQDHEWENYFLNLFVGLSAREFAQAVLNKNKFIHVDIKKMSGGIRKATIYKLPFTAEQRKLFDEIIGLCAASNNTKVRDTFFNQAELSYVKAVFSAMLLDEILLIDFVNAYIEPVKIVEAIDGLPIEHPSRLYLDEIKTPMRGSMLESIQICGLKTLYEFRELIGQRIEEMS